MLLVLPVSKADSHLIPTMVQAFTQFQPGLGHDLLVVGSPNVKTEADVLGLTLAHYFNTSATHTFESDNHMGWPMGCNYYFQQTAFFVARHYRTPWLWFELDTTPIKQGWLSLIEEEYAANNKPFLGIKEPVVLADDNGEMADVSTVGHYMSPVGAYPHNSPDYILNLPALETTTQRWWYFCRWMITPFMVQSARIQNNWNTIKYKRTNQGIICEDYSNMAWHIPKDCSILDATAIVHGCKDGSLSYLFTAGPSRDEALLAKRKKKYREARRARAETTIQT